MIMQEDLDFLEHFGKKGMKWGVRNNGRRGDGKLTRTRQAVVNQNNAAVKRIDKKSAKAKAKGKTVKYDPAQLRRQNQKKEFNQQTDRIRSGKLIAEDRLRIYGTVSLTSLAVAYRSPEFKK